MQIGRAAARAGLTVKTVRYYADIGLVAPVRRDSGYRDYDSDAVHRLRFVARARELGFSVEECRQLLDLYRSDDRSSADVKALAQAKLDQIDAKLEGLREMRATLAHLVARCAGDDRPDCPILDDLAARKDKQ